MKEERFEISEGFLLNSILALSGGFQDAYTYNARGRVFSNAQTGNIVLMSQNFMTGDWMTGLSYLFPVVSFALGVIASEQVGHRFKDRSSPHWRQIVVIIEAFILLLVGLIPVQYNMLATALVSFSCAMQVQSFQKVKGYSYASTMCIGNLRSGMESLSKYFHERDKNILRKAMHYYGIIFIFAVGAGFGGILSNLFDLRVIWISSFLLLITVIMIGMEVKRKEG